MAAKFKKTDLFMIHNSIARVEKFINYIMFDGKKNVARKVFDSVLKSIKDGGHDNPMLVRETAIENASPDIMVKSKRIGGAVFAIPLEIKGDKRFYFGCRWLLEDSRSKKGSIVKKLTKSLLDAYINQGYAVKKKEDAHRNAEANKANAHLAKYVK